MKILDALYYGFPSVSGQQLVLLSQVLADDSTLGYEDMSNMQVGIVLECGVHHHVAGCDCVNTEAASGFMHVTLGVHGHKPGVGVPELMLKVVHGAANYMCSGLPAWDKASAVLGFLLGDCHVLLIIPFLSQH